MSQTLDIPSLLPWGEPEDVKTKRGQRVLRKTAPTETFWQLWRSDKDALKSAGVAVGRKDGQWEVCWWQTAGKAEQPTETADQQPARAQAATIFGGRKPVALPVSLKLSGEQVAIISVFKDAKSGNIVVLARAGTGKTFTIELGLREAQEESILYAVFNKKNQVEAQAKITNPRVDTRTLHSLGFGFIKEVWPTAKPDDDVERDRVARFEPDAPAEVAAAVEKLVGFAKNCFVGTPTTAELADLADVRQVECPNYEEPEAGGWTVPRIADVAMRVLEASKIKEDDGRISFNDMVWLPCAMGWVRPRYDLVVVDECQDMSSPQLLMAMTACRKGGRIVVVGDDRQAIYGFRGAAQGGMESMKQALAAKTMPLTMTYRCPKSVVALAAALVPDYRAADAAPEGEVVHMSDGDLVGSLAVGDAVLSRLNAPLMSLCLQTLKRGVPARIEGRDIGRQLVNFVRQVKGRSVPDFITKVERWGEKMRKRALKSKHAEAKCDAIGDQVDTMVAVAEGCASVGEIELRIKSLFTDGDEGRKPSVIFSSVHKAKGLEFDNVHLLSWTFCRKGKGRPDPRQASEEQNIYYVALTRSKRRLVLVSQGGRAEHPGVAKTATGSAV